jgi:acyl-CoA synthetase (NDP forming)
MAFRPLAWRVAADAAEAAAAAAAIGYPVVVKADAASILHKSDHGGVAVNLADAEAVGAAVAEMQQRLSAPDLTFLVQEFVPGGLEVICGAKAEPGLGHMVMFGMGGIYVEVLKDVVFEL